MPKNSYLTVTDNFCGAGGSSIGAVAAGVELKMALNHWPLAIKTHSTNFPNASHDCTDVSASNPRRYPATDIMIASPECFVAGTLILAKRGLIPIEQVIVGDHVLTHLNRWRPVRAVMTHSATETLFVSGQGHPGLEVTANHPFWARQQTQVWDNKKRDYNRRVFGGPEWIEAHQLKSAKYRWATPNFASVGNSERLDVPPVPGRGMDISDINFWWLVGRWLGDGTLRLRPGEQGGEITIVCGENEVDELESRLAHWLPKHDRYRAEQNELRWRKRRIRTAYLFECGHQGLCEWLVAHFGKLAYAKTMPTWALMMPWSWRENLLAGYLSADGSYTKRKTMATSVSKTLAIGIRLLAESLGYKTGLYQYKQHSKTIEGRTLNVRDQWIVAWENNASEREAFSEDGFSWSLVKKIAPSGVRADVYNLSVEEDESYIADGIVVHNCTNHSLAKGKTRKTSPQLDMFGKDGPDPAEERSRMTMWDVPRFAEVHRYNIVVVENVVDARYWELWDAWLLAMDLLGYDHKIVYFNSMHAHPTPQSRDRMYVVFWRKGNRAPNLEFTPRAYCGKCERDIPSVQAWKKPNFRWGRYRKQYVYVCPVCATVVEPYYFCAANAIDWSLPAPRIGDREKPLKEKTLARIRVGLEKFARPFLYDSVHTARNGRDTDMVWPADGPGRTQLGTATHGMVVPPHVVNLSYTHAENSRSYPLTDPAPTQTGWQTFGLVIPPFITTLHGKSDVASLMQPLPTQLGSIHHYLSVPPYVVDLRGENAPKSLEEVLSTICASGNHHGLVMPFLTSYYGTNEGSPLDEAVPTITTIDKHAVVVPPFLVSLNRSDTDRNRPVSNEFPTVMPSEMPAMAIPPFILSYYTRESGAGAALAGIDESLPTQPTWPVHYLAHPGAKPEPDECGFRMLQPHEIQKAMAFPDDYVILGNAREKVKQLGNAVTSPVMKMLMERCVESLQ